MTEPDLSVLDELFRRSMLLSVYRRFRALRNEHPKTVWTAAVIAPVAVALLLDRYVPLPLLTLLLTPALLLVGILFSIGQAALLCLLFPLLFLVVKVWHDPSATAVAWPMAVWSLLHFGTCTALLAGWKSSIRLTAEIAERDTLTGAGNSTSFYRRGRQAIISCLAARKPLSVAVMDCDSFKPFNDTRGHLAGDEFLKQVATTIQQRLRPDDVLIRWGGDEFVILLPDYPPAGAENLVDELRAALSTALALMAASVTFSWGLVTYDIPPADAETLLKDADTLMYQAKNAGGDRLRSRHVESPRSV